MARVRVVLNQRSLTAILRGEVGRMRPELDERGERIAAAAGRGYESEGWPGRRRYRVTARSAEPVVVADSPLLRAVDAGRGA